MALKQRRAVQGGSIPTRGASAEQVAVVPGSSDHVAVAAAAAAPNDVNYDPKQKTRRPDEKVTMRLSFIARQPVWILLAIASGACAAINGAFAKLTTTSLTSTLASDLSAFLGLSEYNDVVNVVLRGAFFGLNLLFNAVMWGLFTAALTRGNSTTRVSIVNVSANFFVTAMLGWAIFGEKLPLQWWAGAGLLAAGNVIIGSSREEGDGESTKGAVANDSDEGEGLLARTGDQGDSRIEMETPSEGEDKDEVRVNLSAEEGRLRRGEDIDDPV